ncbi:MAG: NAD(P)-dependent oxidoreductase, partial [Candidatus Hydrogenedentes bacterium]|nr:NAD(P)-dependent oxidoreductase [Candidatus Hydrogenedentota bacterium]
SPDALASFPRTWESRTRQELIEASLDPCVRGNDGIDSGAGETLGQHCGCILLSLPTSEIRQELLFGADGLAKKLAEGTLLLDTTTGRAEDLEEDAERLAEAQIDLVDVCVLGSSTQVERGEAVLLVGDSAAGASGYDSLLECFSRKIFYLGTAGDGCRMKLVANQVIGLHRLVLAEALGMAEKAGLDLGKTLEVLQSGPAASQVMATKGRKMIDRDFTPQARLAQHAKDVGLILEMAESVGAEVPVSLLHRDVLQDLIDAGYGGEDNAAVIWAFRGGDCLAQAHRAE